MTGTPDGRWIEVGDGVLARRHTELDLTTGLVLGAERALVVDTRGDDQQGAELAEAIRAVTALPLTVVITHAHFDHCFGTAAFLPCPVYVATAGFDPLRDEGEELAERLRRAGVPVMGRRFPGLVHGYAGLSAISAAARDATLDAASALRAGLALAGRPASSAALSPAVPRPRSTARLR